jgi:hypothetical protein
MPDIDWREKIPALIGRGESSSIDEVNDSEMLYLLPRPVISEHSLRHLLMLYYTVFKIIDSGDSTVVHNII